MLTTPAKFTDSIHHFCQELVPNSTPIYVAVRPETNGQINNCFDVVDSVVIERGGNRRDGWLIWEWPGVLLEAIFHAVHVQSDESLVDVTPKEDRESRILFLPDSNRSYTDQLIGSQFFPLMDHTSVHEYIQTAQEMTDVRRSVSPDGLGEMPSHRWLPLKRRLGELVAAIQVESQRRDALAALTDQPIETNDEVVRIEIHGCQQLAAQGDFRGAMDRGLKLVHQDRTRFGEPVRQFMLKVFQSVSDQPVLVREYQRLLSQALY